MSLQPLFGSSSRAVFTAAITMLVAGDVLAQGFIVAGVTNRSGSIAASGGGLGSQSTGYALTTPDTWQLPLDFLEAVSVGTFLNGAGTSLNSSSAWLGLVPPIDACIGFEMSFDAGGNAASQGPSTSTSCAVSSTFNFFVTGLGPGETLPVVLSGGFGNFGSAGTISLQLRRENVVLYQNPAVPSLLFDETFHLTEGPHSVVLEFQNTISAPVAGSSTFFQAFCFLSLKDANQLGFGCGQTGSCQIPQATPHCADALCCEYVCANLDPSCCAVQWDQACVVAALNFCNAWPIVRPVRNPIDGRRYRLLSSAARVFLERWAEQNDLSLAVVRGAAENAWLRHGMGNLQGVPRTLTLGLVDPAGAGDFAWSNGEASDYRNWAPGEPAATGPTAARLRPDDGLWFAPDEPNAHFGLVELSQPACAPGSGDCFLHNGTPGCDTLSCCHVICDELDPFCCDVAWDAICAGRAADHCSPTIFAGPFQVLGTWCYLLTPSAATEAQKVALSLGGHLATIESPLKNTMIRNQVGSFDGIARNLWIGFTDEASEGFWTWMSNAPVTYTNWAPNEPNNSGGHEHFATVLPSGQWNDIRNTTNALVWGVVEVVPKCGLPNSGDCFTPTNNPYCDDAQCCAAVCAIDPICCAMDWDLPCAAAALRICVKAACPADLNGDGAVDGADLGLLLDAWGTAGAADLNGDGTVDGADLGLLLDAWGACG